MEPIEFADFVRLTVAIVLHDEEALREFGQRFARFGHVHQFHEVALQSHLFCGFPRTLASLDVLKDAGLNLQDPGYESPAEGAGAELFDRIYGDGSAQVRGHLEQLSPDFAGWIHSHAYQAVLARPGLLPVEREMLAVVALAATGHDRQLASHVRGAVRCGAPPAAVLEVIELLEGLIDAERAERAREVAARFTRA